MVLLSVVAPACSHKQSAEIGKPDDPAVIEASKSVEQFHALVNDGRYREVCQIAEPGAFAAVSEAVESGSMGCEKYCCPSWL